MAHIFGGLRGPQCLSCFRRFTGVVRGEPWLALAGPANQHVRGKKKIAKQTTIKVRLLADIPRYGRKGRKVKSISLAILMRFDDRLDYTNCTWTNAKFLAS